MFIPNSGASLRSAGFLLASLAASVQAMGADNNAIDNTATLAPVVIIGTTPLAGVGLAKEHIPDAVQTAGAADIARSNALI